MTVTIDGQIYHLIVEVCRLARAKLLSFAGLTQAFLRKPDAGTGEAGGNSLKMKLKAPAFTCARM